MTEPQQNGSFCMAEITKESPNWIPDEVHLIYFFI